MFSFLFYIIANGFDFYNISEIKNFGLSAGMDIIITCKTMNKLHLEINAMIVKCKNYLIKFITYAVTGAEFIPIRYFKFIFLMLPFL
jgi:hypothetical protein